MQHWYRPRFAPLTNRPGCHAPRPWPPTEALTHLAGAAQQAKAASARSTLEAYYREVRVLRLLTSALKSSGHRATTALIRLCWLHDQYGAGTAEADADFQRLGKERMRADRNIIDPAL